jgi:hypothetical protein
VPASKIAQADLKYIEMVTSVDDGKLLEKKADTRDIHPRRDRAGGLSPHLTIFSAWMPSCNLRNRLQIQTTILVMLLVMEVQA